MKLYRGRRTARGCEVTVDGEPLDARLDLRSFSDQGFEWGYDGAGPRQLALALLADHFSDPRTALDHHERFRRNWVIGMRDDEWTLTGADIDRALSEVVEVPLTLQELLDKVRGR